MLLNKSEVPGRQFRSEFPTVYRWWVSKDYYRPVSFLPKVLLLAAISSSMEVLLLTVMLAPAHDSASSVGPGIDNFMTGRRCLKH